jgi:4-amino-4-deoxy-L-arabinose transferase-like glycosyltransferase
VVMRSVAPMQSHGANGLIGYCLSLPFYLVTILFSFFPWCIYLPSALSRFRRGIDLPERYLLGGVVLVFLVFTLIQTKLPHYTLPAFPLLAILIARSVPPARVARALAAAAVALYLLVAFAGFALVAPYFPSKAAYESVKPSLVSQTQVAFVSYDEQSLIWYFRYSVNPFLVHVSPSEVVHFMNSSPSAVSVVTRADLEQISVDPAWKQTQIKGFDFSRWKLRRSDLFPFPFLLPEPTDLVVLVKNASG